MDDSLQTMGTMTKLVAIYNNLGFSLFAKLAGKTGENPVISPASIGVCLSIVYNGAAGGTERAIRKAMGTQRTSLEEINNDNKALLAAVEKPGPDIQLRIANSIWASKELKFDPRFLQVMRRSYSVEPERVDFGDPAALQLINDSVRTKTDGKIESLLDASDLQKATNCILTNAICFRGLWSNPFDKGATRDRVFTDANGRRKSMPMMSQSSEYSYLEGDGFQAVGMDYGKGNVSIYIFLPKEESTLKEFLDDLNNRKWEKWMFSLQKMVVDVTVPRFKIMYEADLREPLADLGMKRAFTAGADFSRMADGDFFIGKVKHKTLTEVNEEGTEAAAATAVFMGRSLAKPPRIVMNRPFFWAIRDNRNGMLLFIGVLTGSQVAN